MCKSVVDVCVSICGSKWVGLRVHIFGFSVQESVSVWAKGGKAWSLRSTK